MISEKTNCVKQCDVKPQLNKLHQHYKIMHVRMTHLQSGVHKARIAEVTESTQTSA